MSNDSFDKKNGGKMQLFQNEDNAVVCLQDLLELKSRTAHEFRIALMNGYYQSLYFIDELQYCIKAVQW